MRFLVGVVVVVVVALGVIVGIAMHAVSMALTDMVEHIDLEGYFEGWKNASVSINETALWSWCRGMNSTNVGVVG